MHVFVRHPPLPELSGTCYGRQDADLPAHVFDDAAAALLPTLPDWPLATSPARRCRRLADALHAARPPGARHPPPREDARLLEMDFGAWEGQRWDAIPREALDAWSRDVCGFRPPGGESFRILVERVRTALAALESPHVVIAHAGVIRAALHLSGIDRDTAAGAAVAYLQPVELDVRFERRPVAACPVGRSR
jgi:alpha-ribazole phosphatase